METENILATPYIVLWELFLFVITELTESSVTWPLPSIMGANHTVSYKLRKRSTFKGLFLAGQGGARL